VAEFALLNFAEGEAAVPGIKVGEHVLPVGAALAGPITEAFGLHETLTAMSVIG